ncbi:MAG: hypothetical protein EXR29_09450 [Betaproteobacteria bacterium]|nr:hypothetical protein [Betaproteobacteria bacterium]
MRAIRLFAVLVLLPLSAFAASEDAEDAKLIGGIMALVQQIVHAAAHSPDSQAAQKGVDAILGGENAQANRIASGVMEEVMQDIPSSQRDAFVSIGRDLLVLARREQARAPAPVAATGELSLDSALRARLELHAMGLTYWDEKQFAEAVKRVQPDCGGPVYRRPRPGGGRVA